MTIRTRRRTREGHRFEDMTDDELRQIKFFGGLVHDRQIVPEHASEEGRRLAARILEERGANTHAEGIVEINDKPRANALARFRGAWGNDYDEDDESDRIALQQLIDQESADV